MHGCMQRSVSAAEYSQLSLGGCQYQAVAVWPMCHCLMSEAHHKDPSWWSHNELCHTPLSPMVNQFLPDPNPKSCKAKTLDKKAWGNTGIAKWWWWRCQAASPSVSQLMANYEFAAPVRSEKCLPVPELSSARVYAAIPAQAVTARWLSAIGHHWRKLVTLFLRWIW